MIATETPTIQQSLEQQLQDEIAKFVMPQPTMGQCVQWYPHASIKERPEIVFVIKVEHRGVMVRTASGVAYRSVRHITDPKLRQSEYQRADGAWDFTDYDKERDTLKHRVQSLEHRLEALEGKKAKSAAGN